MGYISWIMHSFLVISALLYPIALDLYLKFRRTERRERGRENEARGLQAHHHAVSMSCLVLIILS